MLAIAILAAGKGTRMKSDFPKVLHPLSGKSLIKRVITNCNNLNPDRYLIIIGHQSELIKQHLKDQKELEFILQQPQKGTGHAVQQLLEALKGFKGELIVLNGDVPLLRTETIDQLLNKHRSRHADVTFLTTKSPTPKGYGRVFTDKKDKVKGIIEDCDCNEKQKLNQLVNAGIYCFDWPKLAEILPKLQSKNIQKEIYITDTVAMLPNALHLKVDNPDEVRGVNDQIQLAECESIIQTRLRNYWMNKGVTFVDPPSCTLTEECHFGTEVIVEPQTHFRGQCQIGNNCLIGPGVLISNSIIGSNVKIVHSVMTDVKVGNNVDIGPFAHLRPQTDIADQCKIGNFVEIKKSRIDQGTKINHLSYIGDAKLGSKVNIGAGTITANFDGKNKHQTLIGNSTKTGANSVLVAPISIGSEVTIGAGSTITKDVPSGALGLSRAKQITKEGWSQIKKYSS